MKVAEKYGVADIQHPNEGGGDMEYGFVSVLHDHWIHSMNIILFKDRYIMMIWLIVLMRDIESNCIGRSWL